MERIPVVFRIRRCNIPTLIKVTGTCQALKGVDRVLITEALKIIAKFEKFDGIPYQFEDGNPIQASQNEITVYFYMLFKTEENVFKAIQSMREGLG